MPNASAIDWPLAEEKGLAPSRHLAGDSQSRERRRTFNHMRRKRNELP